MNNFYYYTIYGIMLLSFSALSFSAPTLKGKAIGVLIIALNALIFWR